jgi:hypothetical protein
LAVFGLATRGKAQVQGGPYSTDHAGPSRFTNLGHPLFPNN